MLFILHWLFWAKVINWGIVRPVNSIEPIEIQIARLEERMNTIQAKYEGGLARLSEDAAKRDASMRTTLFTALGVCTGILIAVISIASGFIIASLN